MPTFTKSILRPGTYLARTPDGKRTKQTITVDRLKGWADTFAKMMASGLRIPAPYRHDPNAVPLSQDQKGADNNAGFWKRLWLGPDATLYGELDVPRDEDVSRVGTTVTEVSPLIQPKHTDGLGRDWADAITHIALVTQPIAPDQSNFQPSDANAIPTGAAAFCLSHLVAGEVAEFAANPLAPAGTGSQPNEDDAVSRNASEKMQGPTNATHPTMQAVLEALKAVGLTLPDDTSAENLAERILVGARAISGKDELEGGQEAKEQPTPIVMSQGSFLNKMAKVFKRPVVQMRDFPPRPKKKPSSKSGGLQMSQAEKEALEVAERATQQALEFATSQVKSSYELRIQQCVNDGQVTPAYVDQKIKPQLEAFQLSFDDDGKPIETALDLLLGSLEALPKNSIVTTPRTGRPSKKVPRGKRAGMQFAAEEPIPDDVGGDAQGSDTGDGMTDEQVEAVADEMLQSAGLT